MAKEVLQLPTMAEQSNVIVKRRKRNRCCCYLFMVSSMLVLVLLLIILPPALNSQNFEDFEWFSSSSKNNDVKSGNSGTSNDTKNTDGNNAEATFDPSVVVTPKGSYRAQMLQHVRVFRGIPFAKPPLGDLRWRPPEPVEPRPPSDVYNATYSRSGCPQFCNLHPFCPEKTAEDCLFLEIYTPTPTQAVKGPSSLRPVMVYIHGGSFLTISITAKEFNASIMVHRSDVIVVMLEYRLGVLGFLYTGGGEEDSPGNLGILDQRRAIEWIKENIAYFGGDPNRITLSGQSAGAQSVLIHLLTAETKGYYKHAIIESPPAFLTYKTTKEARDVMAVGLAKELNCLTKFKDVDMACLRRTKVEKIVKAQEKFKEIGETIYDRAEPWAPVIDGIVVHYQPFEALERYSKEDRSIPTIYGVTSEEGMLFVRLYIKSRVLPIVYPIELSVIFKQKDDIKNLAKFYPNKDKTDARESYADILSDFIFRCPRRLVMNQIFDGGWNDQWAYMWEKPADFNLLGSLAACSHRACHGVEIMFVFQTFAYFNMNITAEKIRLSNYIIDYYANFIKYGNPNGLSSGKGAVEEKGENASSLLFWPRLKDSGGTFRQLHFRSHGGINLSDTAQDKRCDMWDKRGYSLISER
ncbi:crystal protein [Aplysia californica]|uniref:Carboxylic ester hydrolase n=1 Tax=Aplysia californica TaxID=6500 RepID=A0ABM1ACC9_APLCA|nr:crystal protein [Aplysia californica]